MKILGLRPVAKRLCCQLKKNEFASSKTEILHKTCYRISESLHTTIQILHLLIPSTIGLSDFHTTVLTLKLQFISGCYKPVQMRSLVHLCSNRRPSLQMGMLFSQSITQPKTISQPDFHTCTNFGVPNLARYEDMNSVAKCRKWGGFEWLAVTQGHWQCHHLRTERIRLYSSLIETVYIVPFSRYSELFHLFVEIRQL